MNGENYSCKILIQNLIFGVVSQKTKAQCEKPLSFRLGSNPERAME
jgi:hypothetical protein